MIRRKRKILKKRGYRTAGYGSQKKHRGGGSRGGRGLAGLHKHKIMRMVKFMPDHFGKKGMRAQLYHDLKTISLKELDLKIEDLLKEGKAKEEKEGVKVNLTELGYDKLLGSGKVKHKLIIEAKSFSKGAIKKLEEGNSKAIVVS